MKKNLSLLLLLCAIGASAQTFINQRYVFQRDVRIDSTFTFRHSGVDVGKFTGGFWGFGTTAPFAKFQLESGAVNTYMYLMRDSSATRIITNRSYTKNPGIAGLDLPSLRFGTWANLIGIGLSNGLPYLRLDSIGVDSWTLGGFNNRIVGERQLGSNMITLGRDNTVRLADYTSTSASFDTYIDSAQQVIVSGSSRDTIRGANIKAVYIHGGSNDVYGNHIVDGAEVNNIHLGNNNRFTGNSITSVANTLTPGYQFARLFDNNESKDNIFSGEDATWWDHVAGENCIANENEFTGTLSGASMTVQTRMDTFNGNRFIGTDAKGLTLLQMGNSSFSDNDFTGDNSGFNRILQSNSSFTLSNLGAGEMVDDLTQFNSRVTNCSVPIDGLFMFGVDWDMTAASAPAANTALFGGNVGIGTPSPSAKLQLLGTFLLNDADNDYASTISGTSPGFINIQVDKNSPVTSYYNQLHRDSGVIIASSRATIDYPTEPVLTVTSEYGGAPGTGNDLFSVRNGGNVGIGSDGLDSSAKLNVASTTQGVLFCPMTELQRDAISSPTEGLIVYNLTSHKLSVFNGTIWEDITP